MKGNIVELKLKEPVKIEPTDEYSFVLIDADNVHHFFKEDGSYDGYDRPGH